MWSRRAYDLNIPCCPTIEQLSKCDVSSAVSFVLIESIDQKANPMARELGRRQKPTHCVLEFGKAERKQVPVDDPNITVLL